MTLKPVKQPVRPAYPTREMADADAEIFRRVPARWQTNAAVLATLAGLGLLAVPELLTAAGGKIQSPIVARVAPLFPPSVNERATLAGKFAMPKFLTEEEARVVITEEAAKAGIAFTPEAQVINDVTFTSPKVDADGKESLTMTKLTTTLDGTDIKRHIAYEFISQEDVNGWEKQGITRGAQSPAEMFRDGITQGIPAGTYAVFYDPAHNIGAGEDLRQQVRDFIAWLKAEKVI